MPLDVFVDEIRFFELGDGALNKLKADEGIASDEDQEEKPLPENKIQKEMWLLCEHPERSVLSSPLDLSPLTSDLLIFFTAGRRRE